IKGGNDEVLMNDIVSSDDEREESDNIDRLNDNFDLFFKPYFDAQEGNNICLGGNDVVFMDDIVSSDDEMEESDNIHRLNDNSDLFFKPYFDAQEGNNICTFKKGCECFDKHKPKIYGRNVSELNDISVNNDEEIELLNEGVCKSKKIEVIQYSLGTNEECISINTCEYNTWKRTNGIVSSVDHEIFRKKDQGWLVKRTK
ncbi:hypothetical protein Tco_0578261, partial [Tanacetum coccineum]